MPHPINILEDIRRLRPALKRSEAQVADLVLDNPRAVLELNVTSLAHSAEVSEATVVRFCRSVGCGGFPDFKLRLAECQARGGTPYVSQDVAPDDSVSALARKIFSSSAAALTAAANALDDAALGDAIARLADAPRILCVGIGASGALAQDAAHKLLRFGANAQPCSDPVLARMLLLNWERTACCWPCPTAGAAAPSMIWPPPPARRASLWSPSPRPTRRCPDWRRSQSPACRWKTPKCTRRWPPGWCI